MDGVSFYRVKEKRKMTKEQVKDEIYDYLNGCGYSTILSIVKEYHGNTGDGEVQT